MSVIAENAEDSEQGFQVISEMLMCPNSHVFEMVFKIVRGPYTMKVLWCGSCAVGHRIEFSISSEVKRCEDSVVVPEQVSFFILTIEASVKNKDEELRQFLRECYRTLREFPAPLPEQDWLQS